MRTRIIVPIIIFLMLSTLIAASAASAPVSRVPTAAAAPRVAVIVGTNAPELEKFAADELCGYLKRLFGINARPQTGIWRSVDVAFVIGSPATNPFVTKVSWPKGSRL